MNRPSLRQLPRDTVDAESRCGSRKANQRDRSEACPLHAGDGGQSLDDSPAERREARLVIARSPDRHRRIGEALHVRADVGGENGPQAADKQSGADDQHQRDRHLRRDQL